jgi:uroporphyrinogen-III synthase
MTQYALITRHPAECGGLQKQLSPHGWGVLPYPVLRVEDVSDVEGWRDANALLEDWGDSLWVVMASPRAPERLVQQARERALDRLLSLSMAVVGDATAAAAAKAGLRVEVVGPGTGMGLARDLLTFLEPQSPVVLVCGKERRPEFAEALEAAGHQVYPLEVYRMQPTPTRELPPLGSDLGAVVLTSPRAARLYLEAVGGKPLPLPHWALGPTTQHAATALGIECRIPPKPSFKSLAEELCRT